MIQLNVNNKLHRIEADGETPLIWVLREELGLTGAKYSCGVGECGACTIHLDGEAVPACSVTLEEVEGQRITTIEGLAGEVADALFSAWTECGVPQCGYCQPGQIMQAASLLMQNPHPSDREIEQAMANVLCRCGTYPDIKEAIIKAIKEVRK